MYLGVIAIICKMKMIPVFCSINCYRNTQTCMPVCTYTYLDCLCFPIALNASLHYLWCLKIRSFDMLFNPSLPPVSFFLSLTASQYKLQPHQDCSQDEPYSALPLSMSLVMSSTLPLLFSPVPSLLYLAIFYASFILHSGTSPRFRKPHLCSL